MRFVRIILWLLAFGMIAGGIFFLIDRPSGGPSGGIESFIPSATLFFFAVLMFVVWIPLVRGIDHGGLLKKGEAGVATIAEVHETNTTVNERPVFKFVLDVRRQDGSTYRTTTRQIVSRASLGAVRPGLQVPVRIDPRKPNKVAIDSAAAAAQEAAFTPPAASLAAPNVAAASVQVPGRTLNAADVIRTGQRATATIQSMALTGQTFGEQWPDRAELSNQHDPMVVMMMTVTRPDGSAFPAKGIYRVPQTKLGRLSPGATVPVAYLTGRNEENSTCVDWDRL